MKISGISPEKQHYKPISYTKNTINSRLKNLSSDEFLLSFGKNIQEAPKKTFLGKFKSKFNKNILTQKANAVLLRHLFSNHTRSGLRKIETTELEEFIKQLSRLDYNNIEEKFTFLTQKVSRYRTIVPTFIRNILTSENITAKTLASLYRLSESKNCRFSGGGYVYHMEMMTYFLNSYNNFDLMSTKAQYDFADKVEFYFDAEDISNLPEDDDLLRFELIKDIRKFGSNELMKETLLQRAKNSPVEAIPRDEALVKKFMEDDAFSFENLKKALSSTDLTKYKRGFPLKHTRAEFIEDFKNKTKNLDENELKEVFDYYKFLIDETGDIIKYPIPNNSSVENYPVNVQKAITLLRKPVDDFMLNNEIRLDKEDKALEDILNEFIKVFPEFISIIGKIQHRGDSIDFHTLDVLKRCLNNPAAKELSKEEQRILFLTVMFHDIAKKQGVIDHGHQRPSAFYAKEIIKKLPLTFKEKERIYNLIINSHWVTDYRPIEDIAMGFRYGNDFKMALILAKADSKSAGFIEIPVTESQITAIQEYIDKINSTGIPLFADNLPLDKSKFPVNDEGVMYLDFSDEDKDLGEYGFKKGTTVKDLSFLCHNTSNSIEDFINLCDDSKDVCLSAEYKNAAKKGIVTKYNAGYSDNCHVILHCSNENIAGGGINVSCTGGKKGLAEFKNYIFMNYFQNPNDDFQKGLSVKHRSEISNFLKEEMHLDDSEYAEFFAKVNEFNLKDDIQDIELSSGRILKAKEIKETLRKMREKLVKNHGTEMYANEFIVFRPKLEAIIMGKIGFNAISIKKSEIKKVAKENNIPIILV